MHERDDKTIKKKKEGETIKMNMTPQEIAKEYREAKDKGNQITILADENLTDRDEIIRILKEQGEITDKIPRAKGRKRAKAEKSEVTAKISEDDAGPILETSITPGAAVASEKAAAVEAPESVIAACERELVLMQQSIDSDLETINEMEHNIAKIRNRVADTERQMKEITKFCRK